MAASGNRAAAAPPRALHRFACLVAAATFVLLIAGGLVTSTGSGLAVPDWPLSFGMLFPPMVGGILYEHGHRMVAGTVGILMLILAFWLNRREPRRWVRVLGYVAIGTIVAQAVLGGLTVRLLLPPAVSSAHACLAQIFFCLTVTIALVTSPRWARRAGGAAVDRTSRVLSIAAFTAVYVQLIIGAVMRHLDAGIAIPDMSLVFGGFVPSVWNAQLGLHTAHRIWALAVAVLTVSLAFRVLRGPVDREGVRVPASVLLFLIPVQVGLGILTVLTQKHPAIATAHLATGALVLAATLVLAIRLCRLPKIENEPVPHVAGPVYGT